MLFLELLSILLLILLNGFFAAAEISLDLAAQKPRAASCKKRESGSARRIQKLQEEPERFLATVQIGVTLIGTLAATLGGVIAIERIKPFLPSVPMEFIQKAAEPIAVGIVVSVITYLTLVFGELVPKSLAIRYSETDRIFHIRHPSTFFPGLFRRVLRMLTASNNFVIGLFVSSHEHEPSLVSEDEVKYLIREGRKSGVFEPSEEDLIHSVFRFTDTVVKEVMVPRTEIVAVEAESDVDSILRTMNEKGFSRLPVYAETIDNIIGVVYLKDILPLHLVEKRSQLEPGSSETLYRSAE